MLFLLDLLVWIAYLATNINTNRRNIMERAMRIYYGEDFDPKKVEAVDEGYRHGDDLWKWVEYAKKWIVCRNRPEEVPDAR